MNACAKNYMLIAESLLVEICMIACHPRRGPIRCPHIRSTDPSNIHMPGSLTNQLQRIVATDTPRTRVVYIFLYYIYIYDHLMVH